MLSRTKIPEAAFFWGAASTTNLPRVAELIKERRQANPNPRLCGRCQDWDVPDFAAGFGSKAHHYLSLAAILLDAQRCLVCRAVAEAVEVRRRESEWLRASPEHRVHVTVQGPFFLDSGSSENQEHRLDLSVPNEVSVGLFLELTLSVVPDESATRGGEGLTQPPFAVTPQFQMVYSRAEPRQLQAVKEWEVSLFNIKTLRRWLIGCETLHGKRCVGKYSSIGEQLLPLPGVN